MLALIVVLTMRARLAVTSGSTVRKSRFTPEHECFLGRLKQIRLAAGLTQTDLAIRLGVPQQYVSRYENGETRMDVAQLWSYCKAVGVSFTEFCKSREGELAALWTESGLRGVEETSLTVQLDFNSFDDYWAPFLTGVGPSGSYVTGLDTDGQNALRERLRQRLLQGNADAPFRLKARAWAVRGTALG